VKKAQALSSLSLSSFRCRLVQTVSISHRFLLEESLAKVLGLLGFQQIYKYAG